jgi:hypothetical protein
LLKSKYKFNDIKPNEASEFWSEFNEPDKAKEIESEGCILYYPSNRFEDPSWLNVDNLNAKAEFQDKKRINTKSNRNIIIYHNLKNIQNRFFDIIYDELLNRGIKQKPVNVN